MDAICRKFGRMHQERTPTRNPYMCPLIRKAKELYQKIIEASETVDKAIRNEVFGSRNLNKTEPGNEVIDDASLLDPTASDLNTGNTLPISTRASTAHMRTSAGLSSLPHPIVTKRSARQTRGESKSANITALVQLQ